MRSLIGFAAVLGLTCPLSAEAYIDPGTGTFLWQMGMAAIVGLGFSLRKIKRFFIRSPKR